MEGNHWAYKIAEKLSNKYNHKIVCASGISPSGYIHIGNLREVMTTDMVYKALRSKAIDSEFIFSWDDFDKLRKVPNGFPDNLISSIGKPYTAIKDPFEEYNSYAERFEKQFEETLTKLGVHPRFISQSEMYQNGAYDNQIRHLLNQKHVLAEILAKNMTQGMTKEQKNNYFPIVLYSRFTGKDNTKILNYNGADKLTYLCLETGKKDEIDITKDHIVKLSWKVDWPMRWNFESVDFEPGGPDHASPGSSYDVATQIMKEVFCKESPDFQEYQFVRIKGENAKMSSSKGKVITPKDLLKVYPPELIRWLYAKVHPQSVLDIAFDKDVIKNYIEFDRLVTKNNKSDIEIKTEFLSLIKSDIPPQINFKTLIGIGEATNFNEEAIFKLLDKIGEPYDKSTTSERLIRGNFWLRNYFPEGKSNLLDKFNSYFYRSLSEKEKAHICKLKELISNKPHLPLEEMERRLYDIPKELDMDEEQRKKAQRAFFTNIYFLLFGKNEGPRLPTYLWASTSKGKLEELLG